MQHVHCTMFSTCYGGRSLWPLFQILSIDTDNVYCTKCTRNSCVMPQKHRKNTNNNCVCVVHRVSSAIAVWCADTLHGVKSNVSRACVQSAHNASRYALCGNGFISLLHSRWNGFVYAFRSLNPVRLYCWVIIVRAYGSYQAIYLFVCSFIYLCIHTESQTHTHSVCCLNCYYKLLCLFLSEIIDEKCKNKNKNRHKPLFGSTLCTMQHSKHMPLLNGWTRCLPTLQ